MKTPWLTLITITKDDPAGLARTLASAAALRAAGAQHLVIDGGASPARAGTAAAGGESVVFHSRPPQGISDAFNAGLALAQGEWVWFLNGGDQVDARLSSDFLQALLGSSRADLVIGGLTYAGETEPRAHPPRELQWPPFRSWIPHPATLIRRRLFAQFGGFDGRYSIAMDYEWWLRVFSTNVPADVLAVPFAVFAGGGLSQRPEMQKVIAREQADALRRHFGALWWPWLGFNGRLLRAWLRAMLAGRIKKTVRLP